MIHSNRLLSMLGGLMFCARIRGVLEITEPERLAPGQSHPAREPDSGLLILRAREEIL